MDLKFIFTSPGKNVYPPSQGSHPYPYSKSNNPESTATGQNSPIPTTIPGLSYFSQKKGNYPISKI